MGITEAVKNFEEGADSDLYRLLIEIAQIGESMAAMGKGSKAAKEVEEALGAGLMKILEKAKIVKPKYARLTKEQIKEQYKEKFDDVVLDEYMDKAEKLGIELEKGILNNREYAKALQELNKWLASKSRG